MQRLSGRLREVVVYKNRTTEAPSKGRSGHIYFMEDNLLQQCLSHDMCSSKLLLKFFVYSKKHSAHSEHRDQRIRQVVAYKRLETMENHQSSGPKTGRGRLQEVVVYERF